MRISQIILLEGMKENKKLIRRKDVIKTEGRKVKKAWTMTGRKGVMQTGRKRALKRQYCEIFKFRFFSWISFSQASVYPPRAVSIFFENSRRYSQLKMHHQCCWNRWQMEKDFNQKFFYYFVWIPLDSRVRVIIFFLQLILFQLFATGINDTSSTRDQICSRCHWYRWQIFHWCSWHLQQFSHRCHWYWWCTLTCENLREF